LVLKQIDPFKEARRIMEFIQKTVADASAGGVVVGLSGGVDSSVVVALFLRSLGKDRVFALSMPSDHTPAEDVSDAGDLVKAWRIDSSTVSIAPLEKSFIGAVGSKGTRVALANVEARIRMAILYYFANSLGYLVAGTGDRSENLLGYFTKWGDGGTDFLPIVHLYKTEVRELGAFLGIPKRIVEKPASPQLWAGHKAIDEIPADYDRLDVVLECLFDKKSSKGEAASAAGVKMEVVEKVVDMHNRSKHKRTTPPSLLEES
jgi:NAD+ synthase